MTTEDDFQNAIDANRDDWQTRLVFADWLEERGDPRAEGYRHFLTRADIRVFEDPDCDAAWTWFNGRYFRRGSFAARVDHSFIPPDLFALLEGGTQTKGDEANGDYSGQGWRDFPSRRVAEDALARAFARLPSDRRAELIAAPVSER
jgi:uncharacterized protein (TIGR02996 family)